MSELQVHAVPTHPHSALSERARIGARAMAEISAIPLPLKCILRFVLFKVCSQLSALPTPVNLKPVY